MGLVGHKSIVSHRDTRSAKRNQGATASNAQANQGRQNHQQRNDLAADVLLVEADDAVDERHYQAHTVKDERDEHHHSCLLLEASEINDIGHGDEHGHSDDAPTPLKRLLLALRKPDKEKQRGHHQEVVNRVPRLNGRRRNALLAEEELVVNTAQGHQNRRTEQHIHPLVRLEMDALQLARSVHEVERYDGQNHAGPLQPRQALPKDKKHQDDGDGRPQLVDGAHHGDGQVLHSRITEHPRAEDEGRLAQNEQVLTRSDGLNEEFFHETAIESHWIDVRQQDERQKQQAADHRAIEKHRDDGVADDSLFLENVVEAQQEGRNQRQNYPHSANRVLKNGGKSTGFFVLARCIRCFSLNLRHK